MLSLTRHGSNSDSLPAAKHVDKRRLANIRITNSADKQTLVRIPSSLSRFFAEEIKNIGTSEYSGSVELHLDCLLIFLCLLLFLFFFYFFTCFNLGLPLFFGLFLEL